MIFVPVGHMSYYTKDAYLLSVSIVSNAKKREKKSIIKVHSTKSYLAYKEIIVRNYLHWFFTNDFDSQNKHPQTCSTFKPGTYKYDYFPWLMVLCGLGRVYWIKAKSVCCTPHTTRALKSKTPPNCVRDWIWNKHEGPVERKSFNAF